MYDSRALRGTAGIQLMVRFAEEYGVAVATCLRGSDIGAGALADPHEEVEAWQELMVVRNLMVAVGDAPGFGLRTGARYRITTLGMVGVAMMTSPTARVAVEAGLRYLDLSSTLCEIGVEETAAGYRITLDDRHLPADVSQFVVERDMSMLATILRELSPAVAPRRVAVRFARPGWSKVYHEVLRVRPEFGQRANVLEGSVADLDRPLSQASPHLAAVAELACAELVRQRRARAGVAGRVRNIVMRAAPAVPDMDEVADSLHLSRRTLRRRLVDEGTTYRELVRDVRKVMAEDLLERRLSVGDIAARLGYADASTFGRAYKTWHGVTPAGERSRKLDRRNDGFRLVAGGGHGA